MSCLTKDPCDPRRDCVEAVFRIANHPATSCPISFSPLGHLRTAIGMPLSRNPFSATRKFGTNPTLILLPISECSHLDRFAITERVDVRESYLLPLVAIPRSNP